ncbi:MAG: DUF2194 domain-containing protein, partial [Clostridia bacterium]|nr:DUF2194 domain-containing protein [Clostridia bacterium]
MQKTKRQPEESFRRERGKSFHLTGLLLIGIAFSVLMAALIAVQANVQYTVRPENLSLLPKKELIRLKNETWKPESVNCLVVLEDGDSFSQYAWECFQKILDEMRVPYDVCLTDQFDAAKMEQYGNIILGVTHYQVMPDALLPIQGWVRGGGNLMVMYPPENNGSFQSLAGIMGIKDCADNVVVEGLHFIKDFMIGGIAHDFNILDAFESSIGLSLTSDCEVFLESTGEYPVPLIWRKKVGQGTVVFDNFGIMEKAYRGFHWAAYSLLGDACIYPVINGATFYIDDFPSPVPEGDAMYITRDYGMSISDFYSRVWWNDVYSIAQEYHIPYTGLLIEEYSDQVTGDFKRNEEVTRFLYFGNMLLRTGGEIGLHGFNHMPLVLNNFDYRDEYDDYRQWPTVGDMQAAVREALSFINTLFPDEDILVYVPPSNILSEEGREVLNKTSIRNIASFYLSGDLAYEQEFGVSASDGIIDTPRVISGYVINDFTQLVALSELNYHLVSTHFQHPDDVL